MQTCVSHCCSVFDASFCSTCAVAVWSRDDDDYVEAGSLNQLLVAFEFSHSASHRMMFQLLLSCDYCCEN